MCSFLSFSLWLGLSFCPQPSCSSITIVHHHIQSVQHDEEAPRGLGGGKWEWSRGSRSSESDAFRFSCLPLLSLLLLFMVLLSLSSPSVRPTRRESPCLIPTFRRESVGTDSIKDTLITLATRLDPTRRPPPLSPPAVMRGRTGLLYLPTSSLRAVNMLQS